MTPHSFDINKSLRQRDYVLPAGIAVIVLSLAIVAIVTGPILMRGL